MQPFKIENVKLAVAPTLSVVAAARQPGCEDKPAEEQAAVEPPQVELHLRLVDDVPVLLKYAPRILDVSARFNKMKWEFFEPIAEGFHRLIARLTRLDINDVRISQTLRIVLVEEKGEGSNARERTANMEGSPRLVIWLPAELEEIVASRQFRCAIASFLQQIKYETPGKLMDLFPVDGGVDEIAVSEETTDAVREIAEQVRLVVGGRTLPGACVVESPLWPDHFELRGILAPKPEIKSEFRENIPMTGVVDGFRKSTRVVYLLPKSPTGSAAMEVSFDEGVWLSTIQEAAACEGQLFEAVFNEIQTGTKISRKLTALTKTDGEDDLFKS